MSARNWTTWSAIRMRPDASRVGAVGAMVPSFRARRRFSSTLASSRVFCGFRNLAVAFVFLDAEPGAANSERGVAFGGVEDGFSLGVKFDRVPIPFSAAQSAIDSHGEQNTGLFPLCQDKAN